MQQPVDNIVFVPSLDGLRTIAVGLVMAFHLSVPNMGLGFAGVDVFFVLSGYLITAGLLRDTVRYGKPQFGKFWQRRFRRLLPAATLILLLVLLYATFFMPLFRKTAASWDIFWTALYLGNWRFMGPTAISPRTVPRLCCCTCGRWPSRNSSTSSAHPDRHRCGRRRAAVALWPQRLLLPRWRRAPAALALTVICAVLSYHFVEEPIRRGRLTKWLTFKRTMISVAVIMVIITAWATALRGAPAALQSKPASVPASPGAEPVARDNDLIVDNASRGGCPPLAIEFPEYLKPDHEGAGDCRMVADIQTEKIGAERPGTVFWWSRYEVHQRWFDGRIVGPDEEIFWQQLERDVASTVDRLTADGATLVIAQTERPGTGMLTRCKEDCHPILDLMVNHDEYRRRWNQMVMDLAAADPRVRTFRMDPLVCKDQEPDDVGASALCDDSRPGGTHLRPDGSHILVDPYGYETAEKVLEAVLVAARS